MKFTEIVSRLTGISCPIFGVSWNPPETERAIAQRAITFLEDRRVLYIPSEMEVPHHCVESVLQIRTFLTKELAALKQDDDFSQSLRAMRTACRKFLNTTHDKNQDITRHDGQWGHWASWVFNGALGELRGVFGVHIARIAALHGLDVEDELASILPAQDNE